MPDARMRSFYNVCYLDGRVSEDKVFTFTHYPYQGESMRFSGVFENEEVKNGNCFELSSAN
jgi:hypothetical protein